MRPRAMRRLRTRDSLIESRSIFITFATADPDAQRNKDFRRTATRYNRLATHFPAAVRIAATVSYWL